MPTLFRLFTFLILCVLPLAGSAEEQQDSPRDRLQAVEKVLASRSLDIDKIRGLNNKLSALKAWADDCISQQEKAVNEKKAALDVFGPSHEGESPQLARQRQEAERNLAEAQTSLASCNAMWQRIKSATEIAEKELQLRLSQQLLAPGDAIFTVLAKHASEPVDWINEFRSFLGKYSWFFNASVSQIAMFIGVLLFSVGLAFVLRRVFKPVVNRINWSEETSGRFAASLLASFCKDAPYLFGSIGAALFFYVTTGTSKPVPIATTLSYGLVYLFIARYVIRLSLAPPAPGSLFIAIEPTIARKLARRLKVLTVIGFLSFLLLETVVGSSLPEHALSLVRSVLIITFAINLIWILWLFGGFRGLLAHPSLRYSLSLVLAISVLADLTGYANLASWMVRSVFGSLFAIVVILIFSNMTNEVLEGLQQGRLPWQRRLRRFLGMPEEGTIKGFFWLRVAVMVSWWSLLILLLIFIWDLSASMVEELRILFISGFSIGSLKIVPQRILFALLSLGLLITVSGWLQGKMRSRWVAEMPVERGAREAMITIVGYIGVTIAILVALGIAGIDFSNLAIIAGALSVGIGFGLQNIVNNFVSGLILLFERPIRPGDWIVVGNTEGYVKSIRIRATQIQTFDRADVVVPNSELVSGQVTNWMLHDPRGRAVIPVGVAYGSDTQKVKDILIKVATEHPSVINDASAPEPKVLFRQFGDSSLDFELRCFIGNIDERLTVISDLNFAIDAAFREHGIEIPFPQRDLHIKDAPSTDTKQD
jgi:potassium efflux system protein